MRGITIGLLLTALACGDRRLASADADRPTLRLHRATFDSYRGGERTASGTAATVRYDRRESSVMAEQVVLHLRGRQAEGWTAITAKQLSGNPTTRQFVASGGVEVQGADGLEGRTQQATFDGVARKAAGNERVELRGKGYQLAADRFELSFPEQRFFFAGAVDSTLGMPAAPVEDDSPQEAQHPPESDVPPEAHP